MSSQYPVNRPVANGGLVSIASAVAAAEFVIPGTIAAPFFAVPSDWNDEDTGAVQEWFLHMRLSATSTMSSGKVVGARATAETITNDTVNTVDFANDELDLTGHVYNQGDGPVQISTSGTLPDGLTASTDYWIGKKDANTIQLATSLENALAGTFVAFTDAGSGTHTIESDAGTTLRLRWHSFGLLGEATDGGHDFTSDEGLTNVVTHSTNIVAYGVIGSFTAGNVTCDAEPKRVV